MWVRSTLEEMKYLFIVSLLRFGVEGKALRWVPPVNTQCPQKLAESGERSVLTLGSLCQHCCLRDTAWSWKKKKKKTNSRYNLVSQDCTFRAQLYLHIFNLSQRFAPYIHTYFYCRRQFCSPVIFLGTNEECILFVLA